MKPRIELRAAGMQPIVQEVGGDSLVIGRKPRLGANGVAVPNASELADEHLIVSFVRDRFHIALATGARLEPSLAGRTFKQSEVPFGSEIVLGSLTIRFLGTAKRTGPSPLIVLIIVVAVGAMLWSQFDTSSEASLNSSLPNAPPLFDAEPSCPYAGAQAQVRGGEAEQAAMAHGERYAFDAFEGIQAVSAYRLAAACYANGADAVSGGRARAAAQAWQNRIETRYQGHQLRLRLALDRGRNDHALTELAALERLLKGRSDAYVNWLYMAEKRLRGF
jgi:hypothetical protein